MTRKSKVTITVLFFIGFVALFANNSRAVSPEELQKIQNAVPEKATVVPKQPRRLLVFNLCKGYVHSSIPYWDKALEIMGRKTGAYKAVISNDMDMFKAENLNQFDAVCLNNTTALTFDTVLQKNLMDFIKGGKGIVGIHAATDNFYDWPEAAKMMGGQFCGHPWGAGGTWAIKIDKPDHPLMAAFNDKGFKINDEIYRTNPPLYSREKQLVLMSLDMSDPTTRNVSGFKPTDMDTGISWVKNYGKGRLFYCSLGHNNHITWNPTILQHYLDGIQFAIGDMPVDTIHNLQTLNMLLAKIADYDYDKSRVDLTEIANLIRQSDNKQQFEKPMLVFLQSDATQAAKQFICRELSIIGSEQSVSTLAAMLTNDETSDMALYALERIPGSAVDNALQNALKKTAGKTKTGIINTLGRRRVQKAVKDIGQLINSPDLMVSTSAIAALGKIADSNAAKVLSEAKSKITDEQHELWADAYLLCADKYLSDGDSQKATEIYEELYSKKEQHQIRTAAFGGLVAASGDKGIALVIEALTDTEPAGWAMAMKFVRELPGENATRAFVEQLPKMTASGKVLLLNALADRADKAALPAVVAATGDGDKNVRIAALEALGRFGDASNVAQLSVTAAETRGAEREAARESLYRLRGANVDKTIVSNIAQSDPTVKFELIRSLGQRRISTANQTLLTTAKDADGKVRLESFKVLKVTAGTEYLPAMVYLLINVQGRELNEAEKTVAAIAQKISDENRRAEAVLAVLPSIKKTAVKCSLLRVLGKIGDDSALPCLRSDLKQKTNDVRDTVIRVLSEWPNAKPIDDLLEIAEHSEHKIHRVLALRGFVRMIGLDSNRPAEELLKMYKEAMVLTSSLDEKKMVLSGLANLPYFGALQMAADYLDDKALQQEAAAAAVKIAKTTYSNYPRQSRAVLEKIQQVSDSDSIRKEVQNTIEHIERFKDFVVTWQVSGPYTTKGSEIFDFAFPPEKPDAKNVVWKLMPIRSDEGQPYIINLNRLFDKNNCAAYLRNEVWSDGKRKVRLEIGSDDGIKVWVNGELVHANNTCRPCLPGEDKVDVTLNEGWNTFMLKITQGSGQWAACMRIRNLDGSKMESLKIKLPAAFSSYMNIGRGELIRQTKKEMESADTVMGDWHGTMTSNDGTKSFLVAHVIALGNGKYQANFYEEFNRRTAPLAVLDGQLEGTKTGFTGYSERGIYDGAKWQGRIEDGRLSGSFHGRMAGDFVMQKVFRFSPTLGAKPPASAVVLFDGNSFDGWIYATKSDPAKWKLINGAMEVEPNKDSIITEKEFTDFKLHLEFRTPFMPNAHGQDRGNSGVYLQGRYEVQILDSYGLEGRNNECGGIYGIAAPKINMCAPPMQWQSYDIIFHSPRFDSTGTKIKNARLTVIHNGVKVHDNVDVPGPTAAPLYPNENEGQSGGIYLQNHGNPVQYRNIWLQKLQEK